MTSLMDRHRERIHGFRPLPVTPEIGEAAGEADKTLRR